MLSLRTIWVRSLLGEQLTDVGECLELESVAGGIEEEHGGLFACFALEPDVGFDDEGDACAAQTIGKPLPCRRGQDDSEVRNGNVMAVDGVVVCLAARGGLQVRDDLVAEEIEVDPLCRAAAFGATERGAVEGTSGIEVVDGEGDMKGGKRCSAHGIHHTMPLLWCFCGQMDDEVGVARFGGEVNGAPVLLDDAVNDPKSKSRTDAYGLRGVERVEDVGLDIVRNAAAVIGDANAEVRARLIRTGDRFLRPCAHSDAAALGYGVDGVVEQVGPYLVQTGRLRMQQRQIGGKVLLDHDLLLAQLMGKNNEGCMDAVVDVDGLALPLALVGVRFHGVDEIGDAADALFYGVDQLHAGDKRIQPTECIGEAGPGELTAGALEFRRVEAD